MIPTLLGLILLAPQAVEPCRVVHGRATFYTGDGQLRIWQVGTHHTFRPNETPASNDDFPPSWSKLLDLLAAGGKRPEVLDRNELFADFLLCPTQRFQEGASQPAQLRRVDHPHLATQSR